MSYQYGGPCDLCYHESREPDSEPCASCDNGNKWESYEIRTKMDTLQADRDAMAISAQEAWMEVRALRAENARLRETADRRDHALRLYGSQFEEYFQLAHKRPVPSSIGAMLCNMTERHSCEMSKAFTQDEIARRMATCAAFARKAPEAKGESGE